MTMFNARLGWWLGNPRHHKGWRESSPKIGLIYLIKELTGSTNDRSRYVNLSDGGHFDNLGVYELVRRRCRYIIACDSEADRDLTFEGLGNVIRKVRTDFGVDIDVALDQIRRLPTAPNSRAHCVVGDIVYPDGRTGKLIYLKASLTGDEAGDVLEYSSRHATFPHEPTADQWFDESQFESYRTLGRHVARVAFERTVRALPPDASTDQQFSYLENVWSTSGAASADQAARHASAYGSILEKVRVGADLGFLDGVLYPALPAALSAAEAGAAQLELRNGFYIYFSMIDLMANVFADLELEDPKNPHNAGWLWIFHQWSSQPGFRHAWQIARETYGERFRRFCEREFKLSY
jgi:hypothetical protein